MKLRSFATLMVCAALSACGNDTILPADTLAGRWESDRIGILATFPDGKRPVLAHVGLTLGGSGEFRREVRYLDPVAGIAFPDAITEGTFTATDGTVRFTITRAYYRASGAPVADPAPLPVQPNTDEYLYTLDGGRLTFGSGCGGPTANCVPDRFPRFTRVAAE